MQITLHVEAIKSDLATAAAVGDDRVAEAGRRLSEALESSLHLRLLDLLTDAALGLSASLPSGHVEVRLAGREPELVYVEEAAPPDVQVAPGDDLSARISLRLPETLKTQVEEASAREGISANAWIVRALARAFEPRSSRPVRAGNRIQGFAQS